MSTMPPRADCTDLQGAAWMAQIADRGIPALTGAPPLVARPAVYVIGPHPVEWGGCRIVAEPPWGHVCPPGTRRCRCLAEVA